MKQFAYEITEDNELVNGRWVDVESRFPNNTVQNYPDEETQMFFVSRSFDKSLKWKLNGENTPIYDNSTENSELMIRDGHELIQKMMIFLQVTSNHKSDDLIVDKDYFTMFHTLLKYGQIITSYRLIKTRPAPPASLSDYYNELEAKLLALLQGYGYTNGQINSLANAADGTV